MELFYIEQIQAGDVSKFSYFVRTYKDMAYSVAFSILHDQQDAEDSVQDAYMKAFHSLPKFRKEAKFSTWFYKIVINTALTKGQQNKLSREVRSNENLEDVSDTFIEGTESAYQNLAQAEQRRFIELAMAELNPEDRLILTLYYLHENTLEEVAEITSIPMDNLKMKLHRARKKMYVVLNALLKSEAKNII